MEKFITLEELEAEEQRLVDSYNEDMKLGCKCIAEGTLHYLDGVRYVIRLLEKKYKE